MRWYHKERGESKFRHLFFKSHLFKKIYLSLQITFMKTAMFVYIDRFHPKLDDTLLNTYHTYQTKRFSVKRFIWNWLIYIFGDSIEQRAKENLYRIKNIEMGLA